MVEIKVPFSLYDFWGNIFPGIFLLSFIIIENFRIDIISIDFLTVSFFIFVAYVIGQIIQGIGYFFEKKYYGKFGKYPSIYLIQDSNNSLSKELRKKLKNAIQSKFKVSTKIKEQEMFDLCYRYIIQKGIGERAERFLSLFGFYRGMIIASLIAFLFSIANYLIFKMNTILILVLLIIFTIVFFYRFIHFGKRFAQEVYMQFYVTSITDKK